MHYDLYLLVAAIETLRGLLQMHVGRNKTFDLSVDFIFQSFTIKLCQCWSKCD
jgi:hypothetical protein